jgi:hypothetical protein
MVGGVVAGAAAARFLKASSSRRYETSRAELWSQPASNGGGQ